MSVYEYGCPKCGMIIDIKHSIKINPKIECIECGNDLVRHISAGLAGFVKGSGILKDKKGLRNHIQREKLSIGDDPYAKHRVPGEVDEISIDLSGGIKNRARYMKRLMETGEFKDLDYEEIDLDDYNNLLKSKKKNKKGNKNNGHK